MSVVQMAPQASLEIENRWDDAYAAKLSPAELLLYLAQVVGVLFNDFAGLFGAGRLTQPGHEAFATPQFNVVAVYQLLCPHGSILIALAYEGARACDVPVVADRKGAVLVHLGGCSPEETSHSLK